MTCTFKQTSNASVLGIAYKAFAFANGFSLISGKTVVIAENKNYISHSSRKEVCVVLLVS